VSAPQPGLEENLPTGRPAWPSRRGLTTRGFAYLERLSEVPPARPRTLRQRRGRRDTDADDEESHANRPRDTVAHARSLLSLRRGWNFKWNPCSPTVARRVRRIARSPCPLRLPFRLRRSLISRSLRCVLAATISSARGSSVVLSDGLAGTKSSRRHRTADGPSGWGVKGPSLLSGHSGSRCR
jgi:hypothetical protein